MINPPIQPGLPRAVEILMSLGGIIVFSPLLALSALAIRLSSRGPMIFRHERVGRGGRPFVLYKLRTMSAGSVGAQVTAIDDSRVTRVGKFLRRTKLDEIPELWNVVRGDMSLVGPRPEAPCYVNINYPMWKLVLETRPGITDPVTLRLRNEEILLAGVAACDREQFYLNTLQPFKLKGYAEYLCRRSWQTDVKVLIATLLRILFPMMAPPPTLKEISSALEDKQHDAQASFADRAIC